jgi:hypothetical protein
MVAAFSSTKLMGFHLISFIQLYLSFMVWVNPVFVCHPQVVHPIAIWTQYYCFLADFEMLVQMIVKS